MSSFSALGVVAAFFVCQRLAANRKLSPRRRGGISHRWPDVRPGSSGVLFTSGVGGGNWQVGVLNVNTGEHEVIIPTGTHPRYSPTGHIVYGLEGTLRAVAFDVESLSVTSDPVPVVEGVLTKGAGSASFALLRNCTVPGTVSGMI